MDDQSIPDLSPKEAKKARKRAYNKRYYAAHPEQCCAYSRRSYQKHRAKRTATHRGYVLAHPQQYCASQQRYSQRHPEAIRANRRRRRARERQVPQNDFTAQEWRALCKAVGYRCAYCGKKFAFADLTQDHLTALSRGGSHTLANIIPACGSCNSRKHTKDVLRPVQPFLLLDEGAAD